MRLPLSIFAMIVFVVTCPERSNALSQKQVTAVLKCGLRAAKPFRPDTVRATAVIYRQCRGPIAGYVREVVSDCVNRGTSRALCEDVAKVHTHKFVVVMASPLSN